MPDFGSFYSRYSDVYYLLSSASDYEDEETSPNLKKQIEIAFKDKAFAGGFSYVNFYESLARNRGRSQRLSVDKIKYESPGYININGEKEAFNDSKKLIKDFLINKKKVKPMYSGLYQYLSKSRLLPMTGFAYSKINTSSELIYNRSMELAEELGMPNPDSINKLVDGNSLVFAKIILSFYRRLDETSKFFAQGRMSF